MHGKVRGGNNYDHAGWELGKPLTNFGSNAICDLVRSRHRGHDDRISQKEKSLSFEFQRVKREPDGTVWGKTDSNWARNCLVLSPDSS